MIKLLIKENAVSDINTVIPNLDERSLKNVKEWIKNSGLNIEDCKIVPINRPQGYTTAKRSYYPIIAVDDEGRASWFGQDSFKSYWKYGVGKISHAFAGAKDFYQVVPEDENTYQSRELIRKNKGRQDNSRYVDFDKYVKATDYDERQNAVHFWNQKGHRFMTPEEMDLYDPDVNMHKYKELLKQSGAERYINQYNEICKDIKLINNAMGNIDDIYSFEADYGDLLDIYGKLISTLSSLHSILNRVNANGFSTKPFGDTLELVKGKFNTIKQLIIQIKSVLEI